MSKENNWKPDRKLKEWALKHFAEMQVGGVWMPDGSGLTFVKIDESTWSLKSIVESIEAEENLQRMKVLMFDVGYTLLEGDVEVMPEPTSAEEARMLEIHMKRDIAQNWAGSDGTLLKDMGLENVWPSYIEDREILLDNGDTTTIQVWAYLVTNPNTGEEIQLDPDDYHLLMGDEYFMRFRILDEDYHIDGMKKYWWFSALTREKMIEHIDSQSGVVHGVGSNFIEGVGQAKIPPWMWGTYCQQLRWYEEEE